MLGESSIADPGEARTRHLVAVIAISLSAIDILAVLARTVLDPALVAADLPSRGWP